MFPKQIHIINSNLSQEEIIEKVKISAGYKIQNYDFFSIEGYNSASNHLYNFALVFGTVEEKDGATTMTINIRLHVVWKLFLFFGILFGTLAILFSIINADLLQLLGLIPIGVLYPIVLVSFKNSADRKINELKKISKK